MPRSKYTRELLQQLSTKHVTGINDAIKAGRNVLPLQYSYARFIVRHADALEEYQTTLDLFVVQNLRNIIRQHNKKASQNGGMGRAVDPELSRRRKLAKKAMNDRHLANQKERKMSVHGSVHRSGAHGTMCCIPDKSNMACASQANTKMTVPESMEMGAQHTQHPFSSPSHPKLLCRKHQTQPHCFNRIHIVRPPVNGDDIIALGILGLCGQVLKRSKKKIQNLAAKKGEGNKSGIVSINSKRYMINLPVDASQIKAGPYSGFLHVAQEVLKEWKKIQAKRRNGKEISFPPVFADAFNTDLKPEFICKTVIDYSVKQAKLDILCREENQSRISCGDEYIFGNFAIITAYGKSCMQCPHIDMEFPQFQCSVILHTGNVHATHEFKLKHESDKISTVTDLLKQGAKTGWGKISKELLDFISKTPACESFLHQFGDVLNPADCIIKVDEQPEDPQYDVGTTFTLPGSVIHAGPGNNKF
jgi:hypothetical protein